MVIYLCQNLITYPQLIRECEPCCFRSPFLITHPCTSRQLFKAHHSHFLKKRGDKKKGRGPSLILSLPPFILLPWLTITYSPFSSHSYHTTSAPSGPCDTKGRHKESGVFAPVRLKIISGGAIKKGAGTRLALSQYQSPTQLSVSGDYRAPGEV